MAKHEGEEFIIMTSMTMMISMKTKIMMMRDRVREWERDGET